jgi:hypothetical protein
MNEQQGLLGQILVWLWNRYRRAVPNLSGDVKEIHDHIATIYQQYNDEHELELTLSHNNPPTTDFNLEGKCIFLEPETDHKIIPVMTVKFDFRRSIPEIRFHLALFLVDSQNTPQALGYRFEAPEGEGIHHYYHAQNIKTFNKRELPCPEWIPENQPAFALDAKDCITLIICLLTSLYGLDFHRKLETSPFANELQSYVNAMYCKKFTPTYWELFVGKKKKFYKTWKGEPDFKLIMRGQYDAKNITEISREAYEDQKSRNQYVY